MPNSQEEFQKFKNRLFMINPYQNLDEFLTYDNITDFYFNTGLEIEYHFIRAF
jgi:hypothetical protein